MHELMIKGHLDRALECVSCTSIWLLRWWDTRIMDLWAFSRMSLVCCFLVAVEFLWHVVACFALLHLGVISMVSGSF